jgi:hypothetical protein
MRLGNIAVLLLFFACWVGAVLTFSLGMDWPVPVALFLVSLCFLGGIARIAKRVDGEIFSNVMAMVMLALMLSLFANIPGISSAEAGLSNVIVFEVNLIGLGIGMVYFMYYRGKHGITAQEKHGGAF